MESPHSMRGPQKLMCVAGGYAPMPGCLCTACSSMRGPSPEASALKPAEAIALTVALAQVLRGEEPTPNIATVCVLALARLTGKHDWTEVQP